MKHFPIPPDLPRPALGAYKAIMRQLPSCNRIAIDKAANIAGMLVTLRNGLGGHIERDIVRRELGKLGLTPAQACPDVNLENINRRAENGIQ